MLIRFTVGNFLSFKQPQEFSMLKGKTKTKETHVHDAGAIKLLKFAALFGANASGKSNFVKSMSYASDLIVSGLERNVLFEGATFLPDSGSEQKPSYFEFEILIGKASYAYGFEIIVQKQKLVAEWLVKLGHGGEKKIFERRFAQVDLNLPHAVEGEFTTDIRIEKKGLQNKFNVYVDDLKNNDSSLFLYEMNRGKKDLYKERSEIEILKHLFDWFKISLDINYPDLPVSAYRYLWDVDNKNEIRSLIKSFGTGITDYEEEDSTLERLSKSVSPYVYEKLKKEMLDLGAKNNEPQGETVSMILRSRESYFLVSSDSSQNLKVKTLKFHHGNQKPFFYFKNESDGTQRLLDLLEILLTQRDKVFVIDELDRSLHPQLTYHLIHQFLLRAEKRNVQLIITTHESRIMDLGLLRQDEIWIADKDAEGATHLYSLDEFNVRFDKKVDKAYLEGRYGGVPLFASMFPPLEKEGVDDED
jgi:AAA15 family ATPase/GTPase